MLLWTSTQQFHHSQYAQRKRIKTRTDIPCLQSRKHRPTVVGALFQHYLNNIHLFMSMGSSFLRWKEKKLPELPLGRRRALRDMFGPRLRPRSDFMILCPPCHHIQKYWKTTMRNWSDQTHQWWEQAVWGYKTESIIKLVAAQKRSRPLKSGSQTELKSL